MKSIHEIIEDLKPLLLQGSIGVAIKRAGITQHAHTALLKHDEYKALIEKFRIKNSSFASVTIEKLEREKMLKKAITQRALNKLKMRQIAE